MLQEDEEKVGEERRKKKKRMRIQRKEIVRKDWKKNEVNVTMTVMKNNKSEPRLNSACCMCMNAYLEWTTSSVKWRSGP
jgi:hypothetical protein